MDLFDRFAAVIDAFSQYNNTLSFTAANEVINQDEETVSVAPYIKAIVRDLKAFRDARGYRRIPISYSSTDIANRQLSTKDYLACGSQDDAIEMFGMNVYSWCGNSSYTTSGNDKVYMQFQDTNIPAISSEVGCNLQSGPRTFGEVAAILGTMFPATFSGVVVYEWPEDENGYGLVEYLESDGTGFPSTLADYNNLGEVYTTASPVSTALTDYTPSNTPPSCPSSNSIWPLGDTDSLPTIQALNMDTVTARTTYYSASDSLPIAAASATGTQTGVTNSASQTSSPEAQQGLSTGAIAGIAVGGAVLGIASALLAFLFLRRRRRHQNEVVESHTTDSTSDDRDTERFKKAELPGASANSFTAKQELSADHVQEADGAPRVNELDSNGRRIVHEMSGSGAKVAELEGKGSVREPE